ncbi:hypothetical protein EV174_007072, partial [Coemansia sp. RSA 2320]
MAHGFKWVDSACDDGTLEYEYIVEDLSANKPTRDAFAVAVARCAWERKARRPYTQAADSDIKAAIAQAEDEQLEKMLNSVQINDADIDAAVAEVDSVVEVQPAPAVASAAAATSTKRRAKRAPKAPKAPKWELPAEPKETPTGEVVVSILGELYMFDAHTAVFTQVSKEVALTVVETGKFTYWVNVA